MDTQTDTSHEAETQTETYTVVVYGLGFWGCGNTYNEACKTAPHFRKKQDYHRLFLFTEPVKNVGAGPFGINWEWADKKGQVVYADINDKAK